MIEEIVQQYRFVPQMLPSLLAGLVSGVVAHVAFSRRAVAGAGVFGVITALGSWWAFSYGLMIAAVPAASKILWFNLSQVGSDFLPALWVLFALTFVGSRYARRPWVIVALFLVPTITQVLMWTNDAHLWLRRSVQMVAGPGFDYPQIERGFWFWVYTGLYSYPMLGTVAVVLLQHRANARYRSQVIVLLISALVPVGSGVLEAFGLNPLRPYGATSVTFSLAGVIIAVALFRHRLFDVVPVARDRIFDQLSDAVFVLDTTGMVVDVNPAAEQLVTLPATAIIGRPAAVHLPSLAVALAGVVDAARAATASPTTAAAIDATASPAASAAASAAPGASADEPVEIVFDNDQGRRVFEARVGPVRNSSDRVCGTLVMLRDVTVRAGYAQQLQEANRRNVALLRELQHRVKNSMGTISGLIRLDLGKTDDARCRAVLQGLDDRVRAFAELYDLLNKTGDSEVVYLRGYLTTVVSSLADSYRIHDHHIALRVAIGSPEDRLPIDARTAGSVGLIVTELVTNSLKYAFRGRTGGRLQVLGHREADHIVLETADDGPGLPADLGNRVQHGVGLGLSLVTMLTEQIGGTVQVGSGPAGERPPTPAGAAFKITFPYRPPR